MNGVKIKGTTKMKIKNKLSNLAWSRLRNRGLLVAVGAAALLAAACADDDLANDKPNKHMGTTLAFNVSDVQMDALAQNATEQTRGLSMQPIPASYLAPRKIEATGSNPHDFCLIESTVEGINPVKTDSKTRGTILTASTLGTFSSIGYRAASSAAASNPGTALLWFHGEKTNPDGTLVNRYDWDWPVNVYGRFYAVSPEATAANGITLSPSNYVQVPYIDFEVKSNVIDQVDLMTACSGEVHYEHGNDPTSNLKFTHALAAVKFSIGSNLSPVTIKKIEVSGVKYKGRYKLPNALNATGTWTSVNTATTTVTLDGINMNAAEMPNTMLAGALNPATNPNNRPGRDAYTFLMIPQTLPDKSDANHAKVTIYYEEGGSTKHISFPLTGEWKANTTREYKLSQKNSSWGYTFTLADENKAYDYQGNETSSNIAFKVTSYRQGGGTQQPIPWKISKYEEWDYTLNGGTGGWVDRGTTKPDWLGDITDHGNGGTAAEAGNTAVKPATIIDKLPAYNQVLKDATPKGTASSPYNLANPHGNGALTHIEETANSYLISAPGYYAIPLVYGNAIKNDATNSNSFISSAPAGTQYVLKKFKDCYDRDINKPYLMHCSDAKVVWQDQPGLVRNNSLGLGTATLTVGDTYQYVKFKVTKDDIRNGNAVIAVADFGTIYWSWHLWFDHADALDKIDCLNYDGIIYNFTRNTLGLVHQKDEATTYTQPRRARLTVEQQAGNGGVKQSGAVEITQNPGSAKQYATTLYQFGRKDAFPGVPDGDIYNGDGWKSTTAFKKVSVNSGVYIRTTIQNPGTLYVTTNSNAYALYDQTYCNTWSADNTKLFNFSNDAVVKTIYDPCPAGFHVPESKAFTGFTKNGQNRGPINAPTDGWNQGYTFYRWPDPSGGTIFFPAVGSRRSDDGSLGYVGYDGLYRSAQPQDYYGNYALGFVQGVVDSRGGASRTSACPVRPVADN